MLYLTGAFARHSTRQLAQRLPQLGAIVSPESGCRLPALNDYSWWAADNGCFTQGDDFNPDAWLAWLSNHEEIQGRCLFAVLPDVVQDARATLERSALWRDALQERGWKRAFVAQDGQESLPVPWEHFECLFVGGSTEWKLSDAPPWLVAEAKRRGKWLHMGRVNSLKRLRLCRHQRYNSVDGTFIKFGPDVRTEQLHRWMTELNQQIPLGLT